MPPVSRREFAELASLAVAGIMLPGTERGRPRPPQAFALEETTVAQLQEGMKAGRLTARGVTQAYLDRIAALDRQGPTLRAVLETNPDALATADALDGERRRGKVRGPLHGIPVIVRANTGGIVGMKPTVGLVSRAGIIPIAHSQDTAGPMARTVADAAALLTALAGVDPRDPATADAQGHIAKDYTAFLDASGLKGARIAVQARTGNNPIVDKVVEDAIAVLKAQGAEVVDPAPIETAGQLGMSERDVLQYEFKTDLNAYLVTMPAAVKPRTLEDLIAFNAANEAREMPYFGQETFIAAQARGPLTDQAYLDARAKCIEVTRTKGIDATMDKYKLDAMLGPSGGIASLVDLAGGGGGGGGPGSSQFPAVSGYPHITVPAGFHFGLPLGVSFYGRAWSEPVLLRLAYAFEQATKARRAPGFTPTLALS